MAIPDAIIRQAFMLQVKLVFNICVINRDIL